LAINTKPDIFAWQMRRQARPLDLWSDAFGLDGRKPGLSSRQLDLDILKAEVQLVIIKPFALRPNWLRCSFLMMR
jgi:hypothetical protein